MLEPFSFYYQDTIYKISFFRKGEDNKYYFWIENPLTGDKEEIAILNYHNDSGNESLVGKRNYMATCEVIARLLLKFIAKVPESDWTKEDIERTKALIMKGV